MTAVVCLTAAVLRVAAPEQRAVMPAAMAMVVAYVIRLPIDWRYDPPHHNLWPLGLVFTALMAFSAAWAGVLCVRAWNYFRRLRA
jgi:hypothetical protein